MERMADSPRKQWKTPNSKYLPSGLLGESSPPSPIAVTVLLTLSVEAMSIHRNNLIDKLLAIPYIVFGCFNDPSVAVCTALAGNSDCDAISMAPSLLVFAVSSFGQDQTLEEEPDIDS